MPPDERDTAYLWDMLNAPKNILKFIDGMDLDKFLGERMVQAAVEREAGIIGEAAHRLSDAYKKTHLEVPWKKIVAQRNVLVHEYGGIIQERMWGMATEFAPELIALLEPLVPPAPSLPEDEAP